MKPNFALGMSEAGVTLWQRAQKGWLRVGAVALDHPDMGAAFAEVVATARKLEPGQILTKLVIPDDQILYCRVPAPATDPEERRAQIRAGLAGRTPFPVEELDFDWTGTGPEPHVAVVARETLIEAEEFAKAQGLNPVSFVAAPANGVFSREPFFGPTRCARSILGDPELLERDDALLRETGIARLEEPAPKADARPDAAAASANEGPEKGPEKGASPAPAAPKQDAAAKSPPLQPSTTTRAAAKGKEAPAHPARPASEDKAKSAAKTASGFPREAKKTEAEEKGRQPFFSPQPKPGPGVPAQTGTAPDQPMFNFKSRRSAATTPAGAPHADNKSSTGGRNGTAKLTDRLTSAGKSAAGRGDALNKARARITTGVAERIASARGRIGSAMQQLRTQTAAKKATGGDAEKPATPAPKAAPQAPVTAAKADDKAATVPESATNNAVPPGKKPAPAGGSSSPRPVPPAPGPNSRPVAAKATQSDPLDKLRALAARSSGPAKDPDPEAEKLTIFGARGRSEPELSTNHRVLLIGGGLLMILLAAAVWAFYFTRPPAPAPELAEMPSPELGIETPEEVIAELGMTEEQAIEAALAPPDAAEAVIEAEAQPAAPEVPDQPALVDTTEASLAPDAEALQGRIAGLRSTGLVLPQDMAALPQAPVAPSPFDADALPPLRGSPEALALLQQPPEEAAPPEAAPEAAATPESTLPPGEEALEITVTAGSPSSVPPEKPVRFTIPETPTAPEPDAPAEAEAVPAPSPAAPDALPDESQLEITVTPGTPPVVPPARPVEQMPEADDARLAPTEEDGEIEQADNAEAPPPGGLALAALRPEIRPEDLVAQRVEESPEPVFDDLTPQAVANSLRPAGRPSQFATVVQRSLQAAQTQTTAPVQTAAAAAPRIPSSASVSREATQTHAINLRQVNLIGVMGTPSDRRALVRLSNGRVVTVRVGENLDGGTVTAISETELHYNRRGRDVVLRFPS